MEGFLVLLGIGLAHQHFSKPDIAIDAEVQKQIANKIQWESNGNFVATYGDVNWVIITDD